MEDNLVVKEQQLVVGLGNPGKEYALTRHNLGFLLVERLAQEWGWSWKDEPRLRGRYVSGKWHEKTVGLLMPMTYMNESGHSVRSAMGYYKFTPGQVLVVCDDVALDFGQLRLRAQGSTGGHNGLKSVEGCLKTSHYARLRMGVGTSSVSPIKDHVLGKLTSRELEELESFLSLGVVAVQSWIEHGVGAAMTQVNSAKKKDISKLQEL